jgi:hypothetical protein
MEYPNGNMEPGEGSQSQGMGNLIEPAGKYEPMDMDCTIWG